MLFDSVDHASLIMLILTSLEFQTGEILVHWFKNFREHFFPSLACIKVYNKQVHSV